MVNSKDQWKAWLYLSPAIVLLLIFTVWPIINTVRMSLLEGYSGLKAASGASFAVRAWQLRQGHQVPESF